MDEHSVMFLTKFSFFLVLFVLCPLDSGFRSRCSARMTDYYAPSPAPQSSYKFSEADALYIVLYSLGSTISSSFCDDQPSLSSITITCSNTIGPDNEWHIIEISRCSAQMTDNYAPSPAPQSSYKFSEADALYNVVYYSGLTSSPTISSSFCDDQPSLNSINITCSNNIGPDNEWHVIEITMASVRLNGFIHPDITKLTYLETLDLSDNQLHGSIPSNLGDLSHLTTLDLSNNQLTGTIPLSLGNLKNLIRLDLSSNQLIGIIPLSLRNLKSLIRLDLGQNFLTGIIPPSLGNLNSLEELDLWSNKLSGAIPPELGNLSQLQLLSLDENELNGTLPKELGNLTKLRALWVTSNYLTGEVPEDYKNLTNLEAFAVGGNNMSGPIPPFIANWTNLRGLILIGNSFTVLPPTIFNMGSLVILQVSDLKSTGFAFPISSNLTSIETLDLSFNNLKGGIPDSFKILSLETMLLTGNKLNGKIPDWINGMITRMGTLPKILDDHCNGTKSQYHSLFINAGGEDVNHDGQHYDADNISSNTFYLGPTKRWASVCSGEFFATTANSSDYIRSTCEVSFPEPALYDKARVCPQSLTYYGLCFKNGKYNVTLHFAETVFSKDEDYSSNGKRVFDVYIQGARVMEDFNIKKEAGGPNKRCTRSFNGTKVDNHLLEIRLFWAGKGSLYNPPNLNGPLISAISVTPDFQIGVSSTKRIVVIVISVVSALVLALLLLWAFMWRMGWVGDRELNNTIVKIRDKEYSLKEVIVATGNFGPQNEISQMVYKATLRDQEKLVAVKKLPLSTKQFDQITNEVYAGQKLKHDNLVELLAVCSNKKKKIYLIIYEYMENGSLQQALFDDSNVQRQLDWQRRVEICRGIAKGLEYLHELATGKILHRNIKASKVLLDENFNAKLSDFGLAMLYGEDEPYDFLHKIATGFTYDYAFEGDIVSFMQAAVLHNRGSCSGLVDQKLTSYDMRQVVAIFDLAMRCVDQTPALRPKMSEVVSELERI
ncbi:hypothetical protein Patl1_09714 [Pistacia atlantica]|uniref:Uncharacterized protein n=1 Tax=Pistacia atlantica TaxID=434234 RepID=A0ACC1A9Q9_9ROSI|nr:hypothetical protein Patl1_09714 [Pistacia atlantica]